METLGFFVDLILKERYNTNSFKETNRMNIQFKYDDEKKKIIVSNENGILTEMELQNNIGEIFILEDIIEFLEKTYASLVSKLQNTNNVLRDKEYEIERSKKGKKQRWILRIIGYPTLAMGSYICSLICFGNAPVETIFGTIGDAYFASIRVLIGIGLFDAYLSLAILPFEFRGNLKVYQEQLRKSRGLECEVQSLEKVLDFLRKKCSELQANKEQVDSSTLATEFQDVHYRERLEEYKTYLKLMYNCGYNEEQYATYYQNGCLLEELMKEYSMKDSSTIYSYIEEKFGPLRVMNLKK